MKKSFISLITAFSTAFAAMPMVSNAAFKDTADQPVLDLLDGFTEVEDGSLFLNEFQGQKTFYFINDDTTEGIVLTENHDFDNVMIKISNDADQTAFREKLTETIEKINSNVEIHHTQGDSLWGLSSVDFDTAKIILSELTSEDAEIEKYKFIDHIYKVQRTCFFRSVLTYSPLDSNGLSDEVKENLQNYAEANSLSVIDGEYNTRDYTRYYTEIIPSKEMSASAKLELAQKIKNETGISPEGVSKDIAEYVFGIEMKDFLSGDANEDSTLTLNDAVAVLQNIALPAKYPLTAQGKFNADCDGVDGISGGDALWIQQKDAGLI